MILKSKIITIILVAVVFGFVALLLIKQKPVKTETLGNSTQVIQKETLTNNTKEEVAKHTTDTDCWIVINNKVYDLSNYAQKHQGGVDSIVNYCGKDGTQSFSTMEGKGKDHNLASKQLLQTMYLFEIQP